MTIFFVKKKSSSFFKRLFPETRFMAEFYRVNSWMIFFLISSKRGFFKKSAGESGENQPEGRVYGGTLRPHQAKPQSPKPFFRRVSSDQQFPWQREVKTHGSSAVVPFFGKWLSLIPSKIKWSLQIGDTKGHFESPGTNHLICLFRVPKKFPHASRMTIGAWNILGAKWHLTGFPANHWQHWLEQELGRLSWSPSTTWFHLRSILREAGFEDTGTRHRMPRRIWQTPAIKETPGHEWLKGFLDQVEAAGSWRLAPGSGPTGQFHVENSTTWQMQFEKLGWHLPEILKHALLWSHVIPWDKNPIYKHLFGSKAHWDVYTFLLLITL